MHPAVPLIAFLVGLPAIALALAYWAKREKARLLAQFGSWTPKECMPLLKAALLRGDLKTALRYYLLIPATQRYERAGSIALKLAIGVLLAFCTVVFYAISRSPL